MIKTINSNNRLQSLIDQYGVNHVGVRNRNFAMMYLVETPNAKRALEICLMNKIDVRHRDDMGNTLVHYILRYQPDATRAFRFCLKRGRFSLEEVNNQKQPLIIRILKWAPTENKLFTLKRCDDEGLKILLTHFQGRLAKFERKRRGYFQLKEVIALIQKNYFKQKYIICLFL